MTRENKENKKFEGRLRAAWADGFMQGTVARIEEERKLINAKARLKTKMVNERKPA